MYNRDNYMLLFNGKKIAFQLHYYQLASTQTVTLTLNLWENSL